MRYLIAALAVLAFCCPAFAYDVIATMPATAGATSCQLYLDGDAVGAPKPCGSAQTYPGLIDDPGTYVFAYRALNAGGQSALSPETTVAISVVPPPTDPTSPPIISVACTDNDGDPVTCPASIQITITP